jgi:hypothetical protein
MLSAGQGASNYRDAEIVEAATSPLATHIVYKISYPD